MIVDGLTIVVIQPGIEGSRMIGEITIETVSGADTPGIIVPFHMVTWTGIGEVVIGGTTMAGDILVDLIVGLGIAIPVLRDLIEGRGNVIVVPADTTVLGDKNRKKLKLGAPPSGIFPFNFLSRKALTNKKNPKWRHPPSGANNYI